MILVLIGADQQEPAEKLFIVFLDDWLYSCY
jgi:hypothetical protein